MNQVYQRFLGRWGEGDCAWAALASLFEEPLDSFHYAHLQAASEADVRKLSELRWPHLEFHYRDVCENYHLVPGPSVYGHEWAERWAWDWPESWEPPHDGYWIATVASQTLQRPESDPYYGMPALHAVVMKGNRLAHDPNPRNQFKMMPLAAMSWWTDRTLGTPAP